MALAEELSRRDFRIILGGPQARADYYGEDNQTVFPHRFKGLKHCVDLNIQGPVDLLKPEHLAEKGCVELPWTKDISLEVDWSNIFIFSDFASPLDVRLPQVLQAVGCHYANRRASIALPPPSILNKQMSVTSFASSGCVFCDVARDKGFHGLVDDRILMAQLHALPEDDKGRKVHFELIDEYPIRSLRRLFLLTESENVRLTQVNLVCRVNCHSGELDEALKAAQAQGIRIMFPLSASSLSAIIYWPISTRASRSRTVSPVSGGLET